MNIKREILATAKQLDTNVHELDPETSDSIRKSFFCKFTNTKMGGHIWENILDEYNENIATYTDSNNESYLLISDFVKDDQVLMIFDELDEKSVFKFLNGSEIVPLLAECYDFEFYLTDDELSYFICLNSHDYLIVAGTAADWLKSLLDENRELKKPIREIVSV
jgi:AAA+ ATPase superfamily predicted ATPase